MLECKVESVENTISKINSEVDVEKFRMELTTLKPENSELKTALAVAQAEVEYLGRRVVWPEGKDVVGICKEDNSGDCSREKTAADLVEFVVSDGDVQPPLSGWVNFCSITQGADSPPPKFDVTPNIKSKESVPDSVESSCKSVEKGIVDAPAFDLLLYEVPGSGNPKGKRSGSFLTMSDEGKKEINMLASFPRYVQDIIERNVTYYGEGDVGIDIDHRKEFCCGRQHCSGISLMIVLGGDIADASISI